MKWLFKERFSYFDLICIFIVVQIMGVILDHLAWR